MGQPKAKWEQLSNGLTNQWAAKVGAFKLWATTAPAEHGGSWWQLEQIADGDGEVITEGLFPTEPCDITHLMYLAESELERRLRVTADTMDGAGLVAEAAPRVVVSGFCDFEDCDQEPMGAGVRPDLCEAHAREEERLDNPLYVSETCHDCKGLQYVIVGGHEKRICHRCSGFGSDFRLATPEEVRVHASCDHAGIGKPGCIVCDARVRTVQNGATAAAAGAVLFAPCNPYMPTTAQGGEVKLGELRQLDGAIVRDGKEFDGVPLFESAPVPAGGFSNLLQEPKPLTAASLRAAIEQMSELAKSPALKPTWASWPVPQEMLVGSREWAIAELKRTDVESGRWLVDRDGGSWKRGYSCRYMRFVGSSYGVPFDSIPEDLADGWRIET